MAPVKHWQHHNGAVVDLCQEYDVISCDPCGFTHVVPIPEAEELKKTYREEYYSCEWPHYIDHYREDLDWWNLRYEEQYISFEEFLPGMPRRILDVGSGPGFFLLKGKERGWETVGVEPSLQALAHSRELGLDIIDGFLDENLADRLGTFDVVHMSEVLEHIPDPGHMMRLAFRLLKPGGVLCVIVPNDYNPLQQALRSACGFHPWWLAPPHHINYFNFPTLSRLLKRHGYCVLRETATFPMELFLLMGENYVGDEGVGRMMHGKRKNFEKNLAKAGGSLLKQQLYQSLAGIGIGREVVIYARRPIHE